MGNSRIKGIVFVFVVLFSFNSVLALGVSSPYWDKNPLKMYPGQVKEVAFTLGVKPSGETEKAFAIMEEDAGIAEIIGGAEYIVVPGSKDAKVILKISVPETATVGGGYAIRFLVKSAPPDEEGAVQFTMSYDISFPVNVVAQSEVSEDIVEEIEEGVGMGWVVWVILIVLILIVLYFIFRKKR